MNDTMRSAGPALSAGAIIVLAAALQWQPGWVLILAALGFVAVATALLVARRYSPRALVVTWLAGVACMAYLLSGLDASLALHAFASVFFGSLAVLPWLGLTLIIRAMLNDAHPREPQFS